MKAKTMVGLSVATCCIVVEVVAVCSGSWKMDLVVKDGECW